MPAAATVVMAVAAVVKRKAAVRQAAVTHLKKITLRAQLMHPKTHMQVDSKLRVKKTRTRVMLMRRAVKKAVMGARVVLAIHLPCWPALVARKTLPQKSWSDECGSLLRWMYMAWKQDAQCRPRASLDI